VPCARVRPRGRCGVWVGAGPRAGGVHSQRGRGGSGARPRTRATISHATSGGAGVPHPHGPLAPGAGRQSAGVSVATTPVSGPSPAPWRSRGTARDPSPTHRPSSRPTCPRGTHDDDGGGAGGSAPVVPVGRGPVPPPLAAMSPPALATPGPLSTPLGPPPSLLPPWSSPHYPAPRLRQSPTAAGLGAASPPLVSSMGSGGLWSRRAPSGRGFDVEASGGGTAQVSSARHGRTPAGGAPGPGSPMESQLTHLRTLKAWLVRRVEATGDEGAVRALLRLNDELNAVLVREEGRLKAQVCAPCVSCAPMPTCPHTFTTWCTQGSRVPCHAEPLNPPRPPPLPSPAPPRPRPYQSSPVFDGGCTAACAMAFLK
jgi:hypothetical protein